METAVQEVQGTGTPAQLDMTKVRDFVALEKERRELESRLKVVTTKLSDLQEELLEGFTQTGLTQAKMDGLRVYVHRQLWASAKDGDYEKACAVLKEVGLSEFVGERFNTNTLSSWVRERVKSEMPLPEEFAGVIEVVEKFSLRSAKA